MSSARTWSGYIAAVLLGLVFVDGLRWFRQQNPSPHPPVRRTDAVTTPPLGEARAIPVAIEETLTPVRRAVTRTRTAPRRSPAAERALDWLEGQLGPNLSSPGAPITQLIDSYEDERRVGWIYDASVAVIVFLAAEERSRARALLRGLVSLQQQDGSWFFAYDPDRARPFADHRYVGAMAWVVMAASHYEWTTGDQAFAPAARRGLQYLLTFRQDDEHTPTFGAVSMGPVQPRAYSTEHNANCYAALKLRARLDDQRTYRQYARDIHRFVLEGLWAESPHAEEATYFKVGHRDRELYLDAQTWSLLAFWNVQEARPRLRAAVRYARIHLATSGSLGETDQVEGFNETNAHSTSDKVWTEGTEGMVMALRLLGEHTRANHFHRETGRLQTPSGGIPYATRNGDFPTSASVASTAWFLLNELQPVRNPFHLQGHPHRGGP